MLIKMQKSLLNLIYAQMFGYAQMYRRTISRRFTHMNAHFVLMNIKRCNPPPPPPRTPHPGIQGLARTGGKQKQKTSTGKVVLSLNMICSLFYLFNEMFNCEQNHLVVVALQFTAWNHLGVRICQTQK